MASIETRRNAKTGTIHRVRFRHAGGNLARSFDTLKQAEEWRDLVNQLGPARALMLLDEPLEDGVRTVAQQVAHHIDHLTGVDPGTVSDYRGYLATDIEPRPIGATPLPLLASDDVKVWVNYLDRERGLSRKTIKNKHSLLSASLRSAVRDGLIPSNPAEGIRMPARDHQTVEMVPLTVPEVWAFVAAAKHDWHQPILVFLFGTGARFGEATALRVGDVDLASCTARIRQAWKHTDGAGHRLGTPKSKRSIRTVVYGQAVAGALRPIVEGRPASAYVFTNSRGGPIRRSNFHGDIWLPALRTFAGDTVEKVPPPGGIGRHRLVWTDGPGKRPTPHDARHTYASLQIQRGASMAYLQRQLGHESIQTTIDRYTHLQTADLAALSDVIDQPPPLELGTPPDDEPLAIEA